ncbi:DUF3278 domain-containing protein [Staphylococcus sp. NRL 16/872]|uniref:DUF3278 domain-containing protein n=1 Tax=Staphylococcus sp. NRL 16/872 TaxID=2930131 RepID=UPI001FB2A15D|nr:MULTISPECIES: DUF3278 domain-containing protein [unclassified Staphylococcus]MCJ1655502.1 DUF3278 domain-containing protein [Staphylococcus sp. NRL 21/187]MCJ1661334.1 DUF3278 domain-containing protein [Staphylococcus sp. NRL 18/288]MCJ1667223.1 DUF3278 domain-containing protein [Staphylococcus sp. NRL 19/737]WEN69707.1 DUF3278 domain-containing protein [Staphylococcus sp. NRL 16/872]
MNKFNEKLFNWFTQNFTGRDEREQGVLEHNLAIMFLLTYIVIAILSFISFLVDVTKNTISFGTVSLLVLFAILTIVSLYINRRNRLDESKVYSRKEYQRLLKKTAIKGVFLVFYFAIIMFILTGVVFPYIFNEAPHFLRQFVTCCISGLMYGGIMFIYYVLMIKKEY